MSLLITFKNLLLKKISFLNETNCPLRHLDFDYQEKYNIDVACSGVFAWKSIQED